MPLTYYFDPKERKKILHSMVDSYFETGQNPENKNNSFSFDRSLNSERIMDKACHTFASSRSKKTVLTERKQVKKIGKMSHTMNISF